MQMWEVETEIENAAKEAGWSDVETREKMIEFISEAIRTQSASEDSLYAFLQNEIELSHSKYLCNL